MTNSKIETDIVDLLNKLDKKFDKVDERFQKIEIRQEEIKGEIKTVKTDLAWIKWLFGILGSMVVLLLSIILTVTFKLLGG